MNNTNGINRAANDLRRMTAEELVAVVGRLLFDVGLPATQTIVGGLCYAVASPEEARMTVLAPGLWLCSCGDRKIVVIKTLREYLQLGLKEAKELADSAPCRIEAEGMNFVTVNALHKALIDAGARVERMDSRPPKQECCGPALC